MRFLTCECRKDPTLGACGGIGWTRGIIEENVETVVMAI